MRNILTAFLFAIIIIPINAFSQMDTSFTVDINTGDAVENVDFEMSYYNSTDIVGRVKYKLPGSDKVNEIVLTSDDYLHYIEFDDYNFDGYLDIYLHDPCMILGNCFGKIYIFDGEHFNHDPRFDEMTTVTALPESKTIFSSNRAAAGSLFINETFKWDGNDLILIKRVSQGYAPGYDTQMYLHKTEELNEKGELVVTKEEYVQEPYLE